MIFAVFILFATIYQSALSYDAYRKHYDVTQFINIKGNNSYSYIFENDGSVINGVKYEFTCEINSIGITNGDILLRDEYGNSFQLNTFGVNKAEFVCDECKSSGDGFKDSNFNITFTTTYPFSCYGEIVLTLCDARGVRENEVIGILLPTIFGVMLTLIVIMYICGVCRVCCEPPCSYETEETNKPTNRTNRDSESSSDTGRDSDL